MGLINFTWWNLQNFFDTDDDPISKDFDYTPENGWTEEVFKKKKENLATALMKTHSNQGPDLLAVAEIEKDSLLQELIETMGKKNMEVVTDPSGTQDLRGIDVAIAYNSEKLEICRDSIVSHLVHLRYRTRDILEVVFKIKETGEKFVIFATHWPSRLKGQYDSEPLRIAVAEHISYLVESHVKFQPEEYEKLRSLNKLDQIIEKWETKVMVVGDFNDEPFDRSIIEHLHASSEIERVSGKTNDIDGFYKTHKYREQDIFLYNPMWKFVSQENTCTYFLDRLRNGKKLSNRYQILDQMIFSRGFLNQTGIHLDPKSVQIFSDSIATKTKRPKKFDKKAMNGYSDHLPITAVLKY